MANKHNLILIFNLILYHKYLKEILERIFFKALFDTAQQKLFFIFGFIFIPKNSVYKT